MTQQNRSGLRREVLYALEEPLSVRLRELRRFDVEVSVKNANYLRARWTGECRTPRKGEWFLSGSDVGAYHAAADIPAVYAIAEVVLIKEVVTIEVVTLRTR
jgi:hypothetical protein